MSLELYLAFVSASVLLALMPGPNVAVIVSNSIAYGPRHGLLTVAGTSSAMVPQLAAVTLGLSTVLSFVAQWFEVLRWIGVAYLVFLGLQAWFAKEIDLSLKSSQPASGKVVFWRGVTVSLANPKTLLFFSAFLPQFVEPGSDPVAQLALLSATFFVIAVVIDMSWALLAGRSRHLLARLGRWVSRITGSVLIGAGLGLALARRP